MKQTTPAGRLALAWALGLAATGCYTVLRHPQGVETETLSRSASDCRDCHLDDAFYGFFHRPSVAYGPADWPGWSIWYKEPWFFGWGYDWPRGSSLPPPPAGTPHLQGTGLPNTRAPLGPAPPAPVPPPRAVPPAPGASAPPTGDKEASPGGRDARPVEEPATEPRAGRNVEQPAAPGPPAPGSRAPESRDSQPAGPERPPDEPPPQRQGQGLPHEGRPRP